MKGYLATTLRYGIPFGVIMAVYFSFTMDWRIGIPVGLLAGVLFGVCMAAFVGKAGRQIQIEFNVLSDEQLLWNGPANHFLHGEGVGGWLFLTTRRLSFRSHKINFQPHEIDWPLTDIVEASAVLTLGFIPNGLRMRTVSGGTERFIVKQRKRWSAEISSARKGLVESSIGANAANGTSSMPFDAK